MSQPLDAKQIDAADRERIKLARAGDVEATNQLIVDLQPLIQRIAEKFKRRYHWISVDDLKQSMSITVYRHIKRFDLVQTDNSWRKYEYFRLDGEAKEWLRSLDPLGIRWPRKKDYPEHSQFSQSGDGNDNANLLSCEDTRSQEVESRELCKLVASKTGADYEIVEDFACGRMGEQELIDAYGELYARPVIRECKPTMREQMLSPGEHNRIVICEALQEMIHVERQKTAHRFDEESKGQATKKTRRRPSRPVNSSEHSGLPAAAKRRSPKRVDPDQSLLAFG